MTKQNDKSRKSAVHKKLRRRKILLGFLAIVSLLIICLFTPLFNVSEVSVSGCKVLDPQAVIKASGIKKGDNFLFVDTDESEAAINALGYIEKVEVKRKFFTRIEIEVTEAQVVAYIPVLKKYVGIDVSGKVLSEDKAGKFKPGKALISGLELKSFNKGDKIKAKDEKRYKQVMSLMEVLTKKGLMARTKKIDVSKAGKTSFTLDNDVCVVLGDTSDLDYRIEYVKKILEVQPNLKGGTLDMTDISGVIYSPEEGAKK